MRSKRLDTKIRIILFLLCTIGILYISVKLLYKPCFEGFQTYNKCEYDTVLLPGRGMWKCPSQLDAMALLTDTNIPPLNQNDAICYLTPNPEDPNKKYYTCYQRPAGLSFDVNEGVYVPNNSLDDTSPATIVSDTMQLCASYNGNLGRFVTIVLSTAMYQENISNASDNVSGTVTILTNISSSYCPLMDVTDRKYIFCSTLNKGITIFKGLETGPISGISTKITQLYQEMSTLYHNDYTTSYAGFNC